MRQVNSIVKLLLQKITVLCINHCIILTFGMVHQKLYFMGTAQLMNNSTCLYMSQAGFCLGYQRVHPVSAVDVRNSEGSKSSLDVQGRLKFDLVHVQSDIRLHVAPMVGWLRELNL